MKQFFKYASLAVQLSVLPLSAQAKVAEKDLNILLGANLEEPIRFNEPGGRLFPAEWYQSILQAYQKTPVGDSLYIENYASEWELLSLRIVPCRPLVQGFDLSPEKYCWPEIRLVWQPVVEKLRRGWRVVYNYADDRAIHALHRTGVNPKVQRWIDQVTTAAAAYQGGTFSPLSAGEFEAFAKERKRYLQDLLGQVLGLRDPTFRYEDFVGIGLRPELGLRAKEFRDRLVAFLQKETSPGNAYEVTTFSLPEGRSPAHLDEWIFLAFGPDGESGLMQKELTVHDPRTGSKVLEYGKTARVSSSRDADRLYELLAERPDLADFMREQIILGLADIRRLESKIVDPEQTMVPHTTCASCHRFNGDRFNFHNLSNLEDSSITISERVVRDVAYDLKWLKNYH